MPSVRTRRPSSGSTRTTSPTRGTRRWASLVSFSLGALLPLVTILLVSSQLRVGVTFAAVTVALAGTGYVSARLGQAPVRRAVVRNVLGGAVAMAVTFGVGSLLNTTGVV